MNNGRRSEQHRGRSARSKPQTSWVAAAPDKPLRTRRSRGDKAGAAEAMQVQARVSTSAAEDPRALPPVPMMDEE